MDRFLQWSRRTSRGNDPAPPPRMVRPLPLPRPRIGPLVDISLRLRQNTASKGYSLTPQEEASLPSAIADSGWQAIIDSAREPTCFALRQPFLDAAQLKDSEGS